VESGNPFYSLSRCCWFLEQDQHPHSKCNPLQYVDGEGDVNGDGDSDGDGDGDSDSDGDGDG
jgi:hypothetical protein